MNNRFSLFRIPSPAPRWVLAGILLCAAWCRADDQPEQHHRMENRFLFVIDTSSAMKARSSGVQEAVNALLESGMKGELRKRDTIGLWTFNDHLDTDFPMEMWSEDKKDGILKEMREHVYDLHYEKRSHLEKALPDIMHVAANSERLTVILIFDGADLIKGTPFDKDLNALHKRYAGEFRTAHQPFVTILAARNGKFFDYTINYPGTVMLPHTADPLPEPEINTPQTLAAGSSPQSLGPATPLPPNVQIILSGADFARTASAPPPVANNVAAVATPAPAPAPVVVTNAPPPVEPAPVAVQAAQTNVAPSEPDRTPPFVAATPAPAPIVTTPAKPATVAPAPSPLPAPAAPVAAAAAAPVAPVAAIPVAPGIIAATAGQLTAMFIIAFSLLTIAVVLVLFLVRRWRGPQPSLISQSIDRSR
jgi:von Willebrand factor type A domain